MKSDVMLRKHTSQYQYYGAYAYDLTTHHAGKAWRKWLQMVMTSPQEHLPRQMLSPDSVFVDLTHERADSLYQCTGPCTRAIVELYSIIE